MEASFEREWLQTERRCISHASSGARSELLAYLHIVIVALRYCILGKQLHESVEVIDLFPGKW